MVCVAWPTAARIAIKKVSFATESEADIVISR
ncbi:Uncharacterised protein [Vibrio cholerae]|nr:Uncharacterised protein [Vibrio cholerae]